MVFATTNLIITAMAQRLLDGLRESLDCRTSGEMAVRRVGRGELTTGGPGSQLPRLYEDFDALADFAIPCPSPPIESQDSG